MKHTKPTHSGEPVRPPPENARLRCRRVSRVAQLVGAALGAMIPGGCKTPVFKAAVLDQGVLAELRGDGRLVRDDRSGEHVVANPGRWMALAPGDDLVFASLRDGENPARFVLVVSCVPDEDRLVILPLKEDETPLDVLEDPLRRALLVQVRKTGRVDGQQVLSLKGVVRDNLLGPPIPNPRRIFAVAANFPSHLLHDLGMPGSVVSAMRKTAARVFQKHPPMAPPGSDPRPDSPFNGLIGPFDPVVFPDLISLPDDGAGVIHIVPTVLDYEVELGFVLSRSLTREDLSRLTDEALWDYVAGYLLVSDIKARNPQVFGRIVTRKEVPVEKEWRYLTGDPVVDQGIGAWNQEICQWWGYAASQGNYAALGPYFVAAPGGTPSLRPRPIASARAYAPGDARAAALPAGRQSGVLYMRQCARVSTAEDHVDRLVWDVPAVLRSILSPGGALDLGPGPPRLERGDVIALGTPGGVALTVNRTRGLDMLDRLLFWWSPLDWHNAFFNRGKKNYLHEGDEVFLWGEGLGYQRLAVHQLKLPGMPETIGAAEAPAVKKAVAKEAEKMDLKGEVEEKQDPALEKAPPPL